MRLILQFIGWRESWSWKNAYFFADLRYLFKYLVPGPVDSDRWFLQDNTDVKFSYLVSSHLEPRTKKKNPFNHYLGIDDMRFRQ